MGGYGIVFPDKLTSAGEPIARSGVPASAMTLSKKKPENDIENFQDIDSRENPGKKIDPGKKPGKKTASGKKPGKKTDSSSADSSETDLSTDSNKSKTVVSWIVDNKWLVIIVGAALLLLLVGIIACACCCGGQPQPQQQFMMPGPVYQPGPQMC